MNKKDLLIALTIASVESGDAGIIWDSIPNSIKTTFGIEPTPTPQGITYDSWMIDANKPHQSYVPNQGQGIIGDSATHGLVHGSTVTPGALHIPEAPLERIWPIATRYDMKQLNQKSRGTPLTVSPYTKSNSTFKGRRNSNIQDYLTKLGRKATNLNTRKQSKKANTTGKRRKNSKHSKHSKHKGRL